MPEDKYPLQRDYRACSRLNAQHWLFSHWQQYTIHPAVSLPSKATIADVGTGTGAWLFDAAKEISQSSILHGLDIDLGQCPPNQWLPENMSMYKMDIFDPIPPNFESKYDLVHTRFFTQIIRNQDPTSMIEQLKDLTKDGGYIQWTESDPWSLALVKVSDDLESTKTQKLLDWFMERLTAREGSPPGYGPRLAEYFEKCGLQEVETDQLSRPMHTLAAFHDNMLCAMEEMSHFVPNTEEVQQMIRDAAVELLAANRGLSFTGEMSTVVGRVFK